MEDTKQNCQELVTVKYLQLTDHLTWNLIKCQLINQSSVHHRAAQWIL